MLYSTVTPTRKRLALRQMLASPETIVMPGAFSPLAARLVQRRGARGVYVSGHMLAADLGLPDLGLTTATEVAQRAQQIARMTDLPAIVDADTGFGEPMSAARTVQTLEDAGVAGCHIEDQVNPKRCGHSDGVEVIGLEAAVRRIRAAVWARRDPEFVIIARTDARAPLGLDAAIERAHAYIEAGADVIFADALHGPEEYAAFCAAVNVPVMANLNEFGRGTPLTVAQAHSLGIGIVIYPMTLLRAAMGAADRCLELVLTTGSQLDGMADMQDAADLYALIGYEDYTEFDNRVFTGRWPRGARDEPAAPR